VSIILKVAAKEKIPGTRDVAERTVEAEKKFVEALMNHGDISESEAKKVMGVYWKLKVIKRDGVDRIKVKHGQFLDKEVILRALDQANGKKQ